MSALERNRKSRLLLGQEGNSLVTLIAINLIAFVLINFIKIGYVLGGYTLARYYEQFLPWVSLSGLANQLASRPWTIFTFMFSHDGVWSLIITLLWLWGFGAILQSLLGNRHLAPLYIYGGLAGALAFSLAVNLIPVLREGASDQFLLGGGASVMAIALAATTMAPNFRIFPMLNGGIPLWVVTMIFVIIDYALVASSSAGIGLAHLLGALTGFLYISRLKAGSDWGAWMHQAYHWFFSLFEPTAPSPARANVKQEVFYRSEKQPPFQKKPNVTQQRIDELLDKISQKGYHTLSAEEKEYLKQASKEAL